MSITNPFRNPMIPVVLGFVCLLFAVSLYGQTAQPPSVDTEKKSSAPTPNPERVSDYWAVAVDLNGAIATKHQANIQYLNAEKEENRLREELRKITDAICPAGWSPMVKDKKFQCDKPGGKSSVKSAGK